MKRPNLFLLGYFGIILAILFALAGNKYGKWKKAKDTSTAHKPKWVLVSSNAEEIVSRNQVTGWTRIEHPWPNGHPTNATSNTVFIDYEEFAPGQLSFIERAKQQAEERERARVKKLEGDLALNASNLIWCWSNKLTGWERIPMAFCGTNWVEVK